MPNIRIPTPSKKLFVLLCLWQKDCIMYESETSKCSASLCPVTPNHPCHPGDPPLSRRWLLLLFQRDRLPTNDQPDWLASCKWSSGWTGLLQMIIWINQILLHFSLYSSANFLFSYKKTSYSSSKHFFFFLKSKDQGSISRTFLEQYFLVSGARQQAL